MPISLRAASGGGAGTPIGGYQDFNEWLPADLDINGTRYLRTGYIETDTSKFDNTIFAETVGTYYTGQTRITGLSHEDEWVVCTADNGSNAIVACRGVTGGNTQLIVSTDSGATWSVASWSIGSVAVNEVVWISSLSLFVAVADDGLIGTSPNGVTWTTRYNVAGDGNITGVTFGAGRLVTVTTGDKIITSTNGTSWAYATTVPTTTGIIDVAFGGGKFIAAARSDQCLTSTNGNTWTIQNLNLGENIALKGIVYSNSLWLTTSNAAISTAGGVAMFTSTDGNTWLRANSSIQPALLGKKTRFKFYNGFWFHYIVSGTVRSKDLSQWKTINLLANSVNPIGYTVVAYHLNKWFMFRMAYNGSAVTGTYVHNGNSSIYAGSPFILYSYPVIGSGGVVDFKQVLNKYVRIN